MKNITKIKLALLEEFGHPKSKIEAGMDTEFPNREENDVTFGNEKDTSHVGNHGYDLCPECEVPAMYEGECMECGYLEEEKHEVFMASNNLQSIIKSATELLHKLGDREQEVPAWIEDHLAKAQSFLEQANEGFYFEGD